MEDEIADKEVVKEPVITDIEDDELEDKSLLDYLQDRIGQQISVGAFNNILQSLFAQYNKVFLTISDLYSMDLDEPQELVVDDDADFYTITYDIIDMDEGIIEITDVNIEY